MYFKEIHTRPPPPPTWCFCLVCPRNMNLVWPLSFNRLKKKQMFKITQRFNNTYKKNLNVAEVLLILVT